VRTRRWSRPLGAFALVALVGGVYFLGRSSRGPDDIDSSAVSPPDPGYAARDAVVIETGYDGRERYRLKAQVIRQQTEAGVIDLEKLEMDYHPGAQPQIPGDSAPTAAESTEVWHLKSDRGQVRANGDDVELSGNVQVTGTAPGSGEPLTLFTENMRINTPTEFIETDEPVTMRWSGHELTGSGMQADLKAGTLRLESDVHGRFTQQ
jgi:LPS export ABC transporter protein LptC